MLKFIFLIFAIATLSFSAIAKDVYVKGYYRKNGTYVQPHVRSSPDSSKWNNYGSSTSGSYGSSYGNSINTYTPPSSRDYDRDGISNMNDTDDDNDGIHDDYDN